MHYPALVVLIILDFSEELQDLSKVSDLASMICDPAALTSAWDYCSISALGELNRGEAAGLDNTTEWHIAR